MIKKEKKVYLINLTKSNPYPRMNEVSTMEITPLIAVTSKPIGDLLKILKRKFKAYHTITISSMKQTKLKGVKTKTYIEDFQNEKVFKRTPIKKNISTIHG